MIAGIAASDGVETMCHDVFEPQPVADSYEFFAVLVQSRIWSSENVQD